MPPAPTTTKTLSASSGSDCPAPGDFEEADVPLKSAQSNGNGMLTRSRTQTKEVIDPQVTGATTPPEGRVSKTKHLPNGQIKDEPEFFKNANGVLIWNHERDVWMKCKDDEEEELLFGYKPLKIVWRNVLIFVYLHAAALYGGYLWISGQIMWQTFLWGFHYYVMSGFGITAGTHRYWAHKSYKAKFPLQIFLAYMQTISFQNSIWEWCRDHRLHHKFTETNADPHNARRGFFFAHMGWLMAKKHTAVKVKGTVVEMKDLEADPIVMFQKKYYLLLVLLGCFIIPSFVPLLWGESLHNAFYFAALFRYCATLHCTWLVNSAAHLWGSRPYDKRINPAENATVSWWAFGEGWHNYHHTFPWDYKTAEVGIYRYNFSAAFIDFMAKIGLAYDLKTVPASVVRSRVLRTGDGGQDNHDHCHGGPWGWGDEDVPLEAAEVTETLYQSKQK